MHRTLAFTLVILLIWSCSSRNGSENSSNNLESEKHEQNNDLVLTESVPDSIAELIIKFIGLDSLRPFNSSKLRLSSLLVRDSHNYSILTSNYSYLSNYPEINLLEKYRDDLTSNIEKTKDFLLTDELLPAIQLVPTDSISLFNQNTEQRLSPEPYFQIYTPLLSSDGNYAVLCVELICYGDCGQLDYIFLTKFNGEWKVIKSLTVGHG